MKYDNSIINRSCDGTPSRPIAKTELADYPTDLRDLAKEVFRQARSEGLEVGNFAERLRKHARERGFCESMVDDYLCVFARSNGYPALSKPDEQGDPPNPSISPPAVSGPPRTVSEPSAFPDALRDAARRLFAQTQDEGLGFHAFAERVFEWGDANGVPEVTVDEYLLYLAKKMNLPMLSKPVEVSKISSPTMPPATSDENRVGNVVSSEAREYPDALRELAREVFTSVKAQGRGVMTFARRMFEEGAKKGFAPEMIDSYVYDFSKRLGIPELPAPAGKWQPQPPSFDVEAKDTEEKSAAKRRVEAVKKACKAAVWEDPERPNDDVSKRAREFLQDSEWAYLTENELMSVLTGIGEVPIDTRMEIERRLASLRELAKRARLSSSEAVPCPKEVLRRERIQSKIADLEDRLTKGDHRPPEGYERVAIADAEFKDAMQLYQTHSNELTALLERIRPYVVSGSKKRKRKRGQP